MASYALLFAGVVGGAIKLNSMSKIIKKLDWCCCYNCSSDNVTVETSQKRPGWVEDGDTLTCQDCGELGWACCDGDGSPATDRWKAEEEDWQPRSTSR